MRGADRETGVAKALRSRALLREGDRIWIGVKTIHARGEMRDAEGEPAVAAAEIEDAFSAYQLLAAPVPKLDERIRPKG